MSGQNLLSAAATALACIVAQGAAAQNWDGAYYGASAGVGIGTYTQGVPDLDQPGLDVDVGGLIFGGHAGFQIQNGQTVVGVDAAITTGPSGATDQGTTGATWECTTGDCTVAITAMATLRAKFGYLVDTRTMVYGAGGLALAAVEGGIENSPQEGSSTASGLTYAIGAERITSPSTTIFGEVGFYDLGALTFGTNDEETADFQADGDFLAVRLGVNINF
ncbi:outer membrane protein [Yoonia litorea]|uniref:Opacity protein n=1 Tax=Yoonia litorea TaxID=1123755 RepID=A0A1I6M2C8_9RHOB|nr:outer membrane beta-barrel protein [Yoonia litorea]SFS09841.1 Opacity protein [Yoonia litorea]